MVVSTIAFQVAVSALIILVVMFLLDEANGTAEPWKKSPLWISFPGTVAGFTMIVALVVALIALVWGL